MTGYNTVRGMYQRNRSDGSARACSRWLNRVGLDVVTEGNIIQDLNGIDLVGEHHWQHKAQFDANWFHINIQTREWNAEDHPPFYIWHHVPTGVVMVIPSVLLINDYTEKKLVTNSNQPFYTIPASQFYERFSHDHTKAVPLGDGILISQIGSAHFTGEWLW